MKKNPSMGSPVDNSSILYLALMRRSHTNVYRFTITLTEDVCPDILQRAVGIVYRRFPTVFAGFHPGFFHYSQVPDENPPQVCPDPGMLITMSADEIRTCAYRVFYSGCDISIEAFHAVTDGFGAIASISTLVAQYLSEKYGIEIPCGYPVYDVRESPAEQELADSYLTNQGKEPLHLPSRYAYQLPGDGKSNTIAVHSRRFETAPLLQAARQNGGSITALLSAIMASSIMEIQAKGSGKKKPVRIMVPVDLRKLFRSQTLRNFILYALPTLEPGADTGELFHIVNNFQNQLRQQITPVRISSIIAYNVQTQNSPLFRMIPRTVKNFAMRTAYRFFGESNSSITLTNLGNVVLPREMTPYVRNFQVFLTSRAHSPYNCSFISYGGHVSIALTTTCDQPELPGLFFDRLQSLLSEIRE